MKLLLIIAQLEKFIVSKKEIIIDNVKILFKEIASTRMGSFLAISCFVSLCVFIFNTCSSIPIRPDKVDYDTLFFKGGYSIYNPINASTSPTLVGNFHTFHDDGSQEFNIYLLGKLHGHQIKMINGNIIYDVNYEFGKKQDTANHFSKGVLNQTLVYEKDKIISQIAYNEKGEPFAKTDSLYSIAGYKNSIYHFINDTTLMIKSTIHQVYPVLPYYVVFEKQQLKITLLQNDSLVISNGNDLVQLLHKTK